MTGLSGCLERPWGILMNSFIFILVPGTLHTGWLVSKVMIELVCVSGMRVFSEESSEDDPIRDLVSERGTGLQ